MIKEEPTPLVDDQEKLARFIVNSNEFRSDNTVKPKLFLPYRLVELSVNRHRDCDEAEIWKFGTAVASKRKRNLYGRTDILAISCRIDSLDVKPCPLVDNPNHANVVGYPAAKADQMSIAQKLAAAASLRLPAPENC